MKRAVLIGMNNPQGNVAFAPIPAGSSGHRLLEMLRICVPKVTAEQFLEAFDRVNLCSGRNWSVDEARVRGESLWPTLRGRDVIVFGDAVRLALNLPTVDRILRQEHQGVFWRHVPHPSGRTHWYNEHLNREIVAVLLEEMYGWAVASR